MKNRIVFAANTALMCGVARRAAALAIMAFVATGFCCSVAVQAGRPNVVIVYTDDHGYADLSCQGIVDDIRTPHTDRLAHAGVRFTSGYCTAPQCRPSRAGLLTGRYQNRFGLETNRDAALPWSENTLAERLADAGYVTGMCGKWHLDGVVGSNGEHPDGALATQQTNKDKRYKGNRLANPGLADRHGFQEYLCGGMRQYVATHAADGRDLGGRVLHRDARFRVDVQAQWAESFIQRHATGESPFFLYVPFFAPHVPLEAPQRYLARFPGEMPRRRRMALAMLSAVDDGVGRIRSSLEDTGVWNNTLVFYISDNGAPLKIHKRDKPGDGPGWDGSLNHPWIGEKGMLTEGGIRVPFVFTWPDVVPTQTVYERPVIAMDAVATALVAAGLTPLDRIDGVNLTPFLTGDAAGDPHESLYWRWAKQAAIRTGDWKYLMAGQRKYLFDLAGKQHEHRNLIDQHPEIAERLRNRLEGWSNTLFVRGLPNNETAEANRYFDHYLDGRMATPPPAVTKDSRNKGNGRKRKPQTLFRARDRDKDGFVTLAEYIGSPKDRDVPALQRRFRRLDTNGDERLTLEELREQ